MSRYNDALAIVAGACNPSGIAHAIVRACEEAREDQAYSGTDYLRNDPAIRLMVYQLAYLCRTDMFDLALSGVAAMKRAEDSCKEELEKEKRGRESAGAA